MSQPEIQKSSKQRIFYNLIQRVGSKGKYQIVTIIFYCIIGYLTGGLMLSPPFLFYQDPYVCPSQIKNCNDYVCSLIQGRQKFIPSPSMATIADKFGDYRCPNQKLIIDSVITIMYVGNVAGFFAITLIGGILGRKSLLNSNLLIAIGGLFIVLYAPTIYVTAAGLFLVTLGIQNGFNVCFYFISQTIDQSLRQKVSVAIQFFYGLGVLSNVLWFYGIGDWQLVLTLFYFIPLAALIAGCFIIVKDTPMCLVTKYSPEKALEAFEFIAKFNNKKCDITYGQLQAMRYSQRGSSVESTRKTFTVIDLFRFRSLRGLTLILILLQCTIIFQFYAPALMLDQFNLSIFINGLVVGVSELISYPICYFIISKIGRKKVAYVTFGATFICSIALIFLWKQGSEEVPDIGSSIGVLSLIFLFRFAISVQYTYFYVYFNQLYPTQIRVLGTGLVSLMGGAMVTVAPQIIDSCINAGFPIMIIFAGLSALSVLFSKKLPQTLGTTSPDVIKQLRDIDSTLLLSQHQNPQFSDKLQPFLKDKSTSGSNLSKQGDDNY